MVQNQESESSFWSECCDFEWYMFDLMFDFVWSGFNLICNAA